MFDAVNGIERRYAPIHVAPAGPAGASVRAAAMQAAYVALSKICPAQQLTIDSRRAASIADIRAHESSAAVDAGIAWGESVANQIWAWRLTDGIAITTPPWLGNTAIGQWRQTPNAPLPGTSTPGAGYPQFFGMTPWVIASPSQFQAPAPPSLTSARCARDFNEVKTMGSQTSTQRTADQTIASLVWNSSTAPYLWNNAALSLIDDGNAATTPDAAWTPLLSTPAHPSYSSGHSCVSAAAAGILAHEFGERSHFNIESDAMIGVVRSFRNFSSALDEVKDARALQAPRPMSHRAVHA